MQMSPLEAESQSLDRCILQRKEQIVDLQIQIRRKAVDHVEELLSE